MLLASTRKCSVVTGRNEVVARVIFLHLSVIHSVHGGRVSASVHAGIPHTPPGTPPWADTPPRADIPWADTPPKQTCPSGQTHPHWSRPPWDRHPPGQIPPGPDTPQTRHLPEQNPPGPDLSLEQTPPPRTRSQKCRNPLVASHRSYFCNIGR